jgi:hypothetical protein
MQAPQRQARLDYLLGMLMFLLPAGLITAAAALFAGGLDAPLTVSLLGGVTGAVVT